MSGLIQFNRRAFVRTAGMTALAGAVGTGSSILAAPRSAGILIHVQYFVSSLIL